eukprot:157860-Karenia_brevis.AAC.1
MSGEQYGSRSICSKYEGEQYGSPLTNGGKGIFGGGGFDRRRRWHRWLLMEGGGGGRNTFNFGCMLCYGGQGNNFFWNSVRIRGGKATKQI